jgi:hypothetical protein
MTSAPLTAASGDRRQAEWNRLLWGLALVGLGVVWLLDTMGVIELTFPRMIAAALIAVGLIVPFVPVQQHGGVVGLGVLLTVVALITVVVGPAVDPTLLRHGAGDVTVTPTSTAHLQDRYEHGVGDLTVDLRQLTFPAGTTSTEVRLGAGQVRVRIPEDVTVRVDGGAGIGDVVVLAAKRAGVAPSFAGEIAGSSSERVLLLDVAVGLGRIEVTR